LDELVNLLSSKEMVTGAELRKMLGKAPEAPSAARQSS
jgi:hypothetical protein